MEIDPATWRLNVGGLVQRPGIVDAPARYEALHRARGLSHATVSAFFATSITRDELIDNVAWMGA